MQTIKLFLLILSCAQYVAAQNNNIDSILIEQNKSLKQICKEVKDVGIEISKIDSSRFAKIEILNIPQVEPQKEIPKTIENDNEKSIGDLLYNSFGDLFSALVGGLIAYLLFFKQWRKEKDKEIEDNNKEVEDKNKYLKSNIVAAIGLSEKIKSSIEKFIEELQQDPFNIPTIRQYPLNTFSRLQYILNDEKYFHAFLKKHKNTDDTIDRYRNITSLADYLDKQTSEFAKKDYIEYDYKRKMEYNSLLTEIINEVSKIGKSSKTSYPEIYNDLAEILASYAPYLAQGFISDFAIPNEKFLIPLREVILEKYFNNEIFSSILTNLKEALRLYNEIPYQNQIVSQRFIQFQGIMESAIDQFKKDAQQIIES